MIVKEPPCVKCGFARKHAIDKHHIDGNCANNDPKNIMFLCTACHRELHINDKENRKEKRDLINSIKQHFPEHTFIKYTPSRKNTPKRISYT